MKLKIPSHKMKIQNDEGFYNPDDNAEFKGIFYGVHEEKRYYEFGAHFSYRDLYSRLERIAIQRNSTNNAKSVFKEMPPERREVRNISEKTRNIRNDISELKEDIKERNSDRIVNGKIYTEKYNKIYTTLNYNNKLMSAEKQRDNSTRLSNNPIEDKKIYIPSKNFHSEMKSNGFLRNKFSRNSTGIQKSRSLVNNDYNNRDLKSIIQNHKQELINRNRENSNLEALQHVNDRTAYLNKCVNPNDPQSQGNSNNELLVNQKYRSNADDLHQINQSKFASLYSGLNLTNETDAMTAQKYPSSKNSGIYSKPISAKSKKLIQVEDIKSYLKEDNYTRNIEYKKLELPSKIQNKSRNAQSNLDSKHINRSAHTVIHKAAKRNFDHSNYTILPNANEKALNHLNFRPKSIGSNSKIKENLMNNILSKNQRSSISPVTKRLNKAVKANIASTNLNPVSFLRNNQNSIKNRQQQHNHKLESKLVFDNSNSQCYQGKRDNI